MAAIRTTIITFLKLKKGLPYKNYYKYRHLNLFCQHDEQNKLIF